MEFEKGAVANLTGASIMHKESDIAGEARKYIVDVGMHDGKDSCYYALRGYSVISYEANPLLCEETASKFALQSLDVDIRNKAIADQPGKLKFFVNRFNSTWSSLDPELGNRRDGSSEISVDATRLDVDLKEVCENIHYIKIDIEGYDQVALKQVLLLPELPEYISVENGSLEMLKMLYRSGYDGFKFSNQRFVPNQVVPKDSIHGAFIDYQFERSSSGLWGEDLEGRWISFSEAEVLLKALSAAREIASGNLFAEVVGWFDMHAKLRR